MIRDKTILPDNPDELAVFFDLRHPDARDLLPGFRRAWGRRLTVERLAHDRAVLVILPGGATDLEEAACAGE